MKFIIELGWDRERPHDHYSDHHNKYFRIDIDIDVIRDIKPMWWCLKQGEFWSFVKNEIGFQPCIDIADKRIMLDVFFPFIDIESDLNWGAGC